MKKIYLFTDSHQCKYRVVTTW